MYFCFFGNCNVYGWLLIGLHVIEFCLQSCSWLTNRIPTWWLFDFGNHLYDSDQIGHHSVLLPLIITIMMMMMIIIMLVLSIISHHIVPQFLLHVHIINFFFLTQNTNLFYGLLAISLDTNVYTIDQVWLL